MSGPLIGFLIGVVVGQFGFSRDWTMLKTMIVGCALSVTVVTALLLTGAIE